MSTPGVTVAIKGNTADYEKAMQRAANTAAHAARLIREQITKELKASERKANESTEKIAESFEGLKDRVKDLALGFAGIYSAEKVVELTDQYQVLEQRIKTATAATGDFVNVNQQLFNISQKTGTSFETTVGVFQNFVRGAKDIGATNQQMLRLTQTVQEIGVLGGSSIEQMKNGLLEFGHMISAGKVNARELNAILIDTPELGKRLAEGMGMTVGQFREAVMQGKVLSKDVFASILKQADKIDAEFAAMPMSLERASTAAKNSMQKLVGSIDNALGGTRNLAAGFKSISDIVDKISGSIDDWGNKKVSVNGTQTTQRSMFQAGMSSVWDRISHGDMNLFGGINADELAKRTKEIDKQQQAFDKAAKAAADVAKATQTISKEEAKAQKTAAKQENNFQKYLASLKQATHEQQLQTQGETQQLAISKALYAAQNAVGRELTKQEKSQIAAAAQEKYKADQAKQVAVHAKKQAEAYDKIKASLDAQGKSLNAELAGQTASVERAKQRAQFEEQIKNLTDAQKKDLRAEYDANQAKQDEQYHRNILKSLEQEDQKIKDKIAGRQTDVELQKLLNQEAQKGVLTAERELELRQAYAQVQRDQSLATAKQLLQNAENRTQELYLRLKGQEQMIPLLKQEQEIRKQTAGLSPQEQDQLIRQLQQQTMLQQQLNQQYQYQQQVLGAITSGQNGYIQSMAMLKQAWSAGILNANQYSQALYMINKRGLRASQQSQQWASTIVNGLQQMITSGKSFSQVLAGIAKQLATKALTNGLALLMDFGMSKVRNYFGIPQQGYGNNMPPPMMPGGLPMFPGFRNMPQMPNGFPGAPAMPGLPMGSPNQGLAQNGYQGAIASGLNFLGQIANNTYQIWQLMAQCGCNNSVGNAVYQPPMGGGGAGGLLNGGGYSPGGYGGGSAGGLMNGGGVSGGGVGGFNPSYYDQASALAGIAQARADQFSQMGMSYQSAAYSNLAKQWQSYSGANGGLGGFGSAPQIFQTPGTWQQMFGSTPGIGNYVDPRMLNWARTASGGFGTIPYLNVGPIAGGDDSSFAAGPATDSAGVPLTQGPMRPNFTEYNGGVALPNDSFSGGSYFGKDASAAVARFFAAPGTGYSAPNAGTIYQSGSSGIVANGLSAGQQAISDYGGYELGTAANMWKAMQQSAAGHGFSVQGFASGGRYPVGDVVMVGEHGPELAVFDRPGQIVPNHKIGNMGGPTQVHVHNYSGQAVQVQEKQTPAGRELHIMVGELVAANIMQGGSAAQAMEARYGMQPAPIRR